MKVTHGRYNRHTRTRSSARNEIATRNPRAHRVFMRALDTLMIMRRAFPTLVIALLAGCGGSADHQLLGSVKEELRPVATVSGPPSDRLAQSAPLTGASSTEALGVFEGRAAAATRGGLFASST